MSDPLVPKPAETPLASSPFNPYLNVVTGVDAEKAPLIRAGWLALLAHLRSEGSASRVEAMEVIQGTGLAYRTASRLLLHGVKAGVLVNDRNLSIYRLVAVSA